MKYIDQIIANKKFLQNVNLFVLVLISVIVYSCKDDLVSNDPPVGDTGIDTVAVYEWDLDTISGYFLENIYVLDSNNIYLEGPGNNMIYYNGSTYMPIGYNDPTFSSNSIGGFNQNCVFIGGGRYISPGPAIPHLKVWNGSSILSYEFPNDTGHGIYDVFVTGYNQAWMCTNFYSIYYFNNGNLTKYTVDSLIGSGFIYVTPDNVVYLFASRVISGYPLAHSINIGYKLVNNNFQMIYRDSTTSSTIINNIYLRSDPFFFRGGDKAINVFSNDNWTLLCNTFDFYPHRVCGKSLDNVISFGEFPIFGQAMYIWNGNKWIIERNFYDLRYGSNGFPGAGESSNMFLAQDRVYLNFNNYNVYTSYLLKGKPILKKGGAK